MPLPFDGAVSAEKKKTVGLKLTHISYYKIKHNKYTDDFKMIADKYFLCFVKFDVLFLIVALVHEKTSFEVVYLIIFF